MARILAAFGLFYVLQRNFEMRHYFNDVKVPKNSQEQCEFECLFIFQHFTLFIFFKNYLNLYPKYGSPEIFEMGGVTYRSKFFFNILSQQLCFIWLKIDINF
jgi:hypothetical protein